MLYFMSILMMEHTSPLKLRKFRKNIYTKFHFNVKFLLQYTRVLPYTEKPGFLPSIPKLYVYL